jgi:hypothetical protein
VPGEVTGDVLKGETEERRKNQDDRFDGEEFETGVRGPPGSIVLLPLRRQEGGRWRSHSSARCRRNTICDGS